MYKGSTRTRTVQEYVDSDLISTWTSSGTTDEFESIDISSVSGQVIEVTEVLGDSEWLSIIEVSQANTRAGMPKYFSHDQLGKDCSL